MTTATNKFSCNVFTIAKQPDLIPNHFTLAEVIMLYKRGATSDLANYRPISLSNSCHKLYASMIQRRLTSMGKVIRVVQFRFRQARSAAQPLCILRRLQDYAEAGAAPLFLTFLGLGKACGRISHSGLLRCSQRMACPPQTAPGLEKLLDPTPGLLSETVQASGKDGRPQDSGHSHSKGGAPAKKRQ